MKSIASRRNWLKKISAGMAGLLVGEKVTAGLSHKELPASTFNSAIALIDPKDPLTITKLEIIPVHSLRTIFIKMYTNAGIIGIGEGTVEGRINTVVAAIKELEQYLIGNRRKVQNR